VWWVRGVCGEWRVCVVSARRILTTPRSLHMLARYRRLPAAPSPLPPSSGAPILWADDGNEEEGARGGGKIVLAFKKFMFDNASSNAKIQQ